MPAHPKIAIPVPHSQKPEYAQRSLPQYLHAIERSGGEPVVIQLDQTPTQIAKLITQCQAVLLPGSPADVDPEKYNAERHPQTAAPDPPRDAADELLLQDAYNLHKPILGICYGLQSLNVWRTGTLVQHIESIRINHEAGRKVDFAHQITVEPASKLARILGAQQLPVNSSHHQSAQQ